MCVCVCVCVHISVFTPFCHSVVVLGHEVNLALYGPVLLPSSGVPG